MLTQVKSVEFAANKSPSLAKTMHTWRHEHPEHTVRGKGTDVFGEAEGTTGGVPEMYQMILLRACKQTPRCQKTAPVSRSTRVTCQVSPPVLEFAYKSRGKYRCSFRNAMRRDTPATCLKGSRERARVPRASAKCETQPKPTSFGKNQDRLRS